MEEAPENGKESPHSVHANGLIDWLIDPEEGIKLFTIKKVTVFRSFD